MCPVANPNSSSSLCPFYLGNKHPCVPEIFTETPIHSYFLWGLSPSGVGDVLVAYSGFHFISYDLMYYIYAPIYLDEKKVTTKPLRMFSFVWAWDICLVKVSSSEFPVTVNVS
uniref:Uncharacterized protein n=1 Tax=Nelumbo nucifera TaxID=4432 RepID=A0A822ZHX2_NELNU|nr:TPA_asm: hypothetical protein HUJ06_002453 [Nelumbo nucifera]